MNINRGLVVIYMTDKLEIKRARLALKKAGYIYDIAKGWVLANTLRKKQVETDQKARKAHRKLPSKSSKEIFKTE